MGKARFWGCTPRRGSAAGPSRSARPRAPEQVSSAPRKTARPHRQVMTAPFSGAWSSRPSAWCATETAGIARGITASPGINSSRPNWTPWWRWPGKARQSNPKRPSATSWCACSALSAPRTRRPGGARSRASAGNRPTWPPTPASGAEGCRLVAVMNDGLLRVSEAAALDLADIDLTEQTATIRRSKTD